MRVGICRRGGYVLLCSWNELSSKFSGLLMSADVLERAASQVYAGWSPDQFGAESKQE